jgi:hypothetical protein
MRWIFVFLITLLFLGCVQINGTTNKTVTPEPTKSPKNLTELVKENLQPFDGFEYDNISVKIDGDRILVKATCSELDGEDVYLFAYDNGTLTLKSYCLEALPLALKEKAVSVALTNETIAENANGIVTVRRILPHTSAKFYIPKELFSVTWHGSRIVSALVDLEEERVVEVYVK